MWGTAPTMGRSTGTHILAFSAPPRSMIYKTNTKITNNQLFSGTLFTQIQLNNKQLFHRAMGSFFWTFLVLVDGKICTQKHTHKYAKVFSTLKDITSEVEAKNLKNIKRGDCFDLVQVEFVQPLRLRNTEGAWRVIVNGIHVYRSGNAHSCQSSSSCHHHHHH